MPYVLGRHALALPPGSQIMGDVAASRLKPFMNDKRLGDVGVSHSENLILPFAVLCHPPKVLAELLKCCEGILS